MMNIRPLLRLWAVAAMAAVCLSGSAVYLSGCGRAVPGPPTPDGGTSAPPSTPGASGPAAVTTLAIYYLGEERRYREVGGSVDRIRLYREFHRLPAGDGSPQARTAAAVAAMLRDSASDPDYHTGWPASAQVRAVVVGSDSVTVDLSGAATNSVGAEAAHQAVQQLIWTATAASGKPGVRLLLDGAPVSELWGHVAVGGVLRRAPALETLALVWLIDPQHGATVARTFTIHVSGSTFESTIQLRVRQGDQTVRELFVTVAAPVGNQFGEAKTTITLPAGSYTIEAYEASAVDGRAMSIDDHTITVT